MIAMPTDSAPTVDIVINNYNYARYLGEAIASVRAQTHPAVNLIVVDDGSTDDSRAVIEALRGDDMTVVLKENGGQASALNAGAEVCDGEVVIFLDADDTLKPTAAAKAAAALAGPGQPARVQYRMEVIDGEGRPSGEIKPFEYLPLPGGDLRREELTYSFDLGWQPTSANAFRAEALRQVLPVPEDTFRILADWYLVHTTSVLGPVAALDEVCASYRVHGANNFEHDEAVLNLDRLRNSIRLARPTVEALRRLGAEVGLPLPRHTTSVADLGHRMISLKLDPDRHPWPDDTIPRLLREAAWVIPRRNNVSASMKAMYAGWFVTIAAAPRRQAHRLATYFLYPESRDALNGLLGRFHRGGPV